MKRNGIPSRIIIEFVTPRQESYALLPEPAVLGYLWYYTRSDVTCQYLFEKKFKNFSAELFHPADIINHNCFSFP